MRECNVHYTLYLRGLEILRGFKGLGVIWSWLYGHAWQY